MAKVLEQTGPSGFMQTRLYRVRELGADETAPASARPVPVATGDFDWTPDTEQGVTDAIKAADDFKKPAKPEGA